jgi:hypothetical protein
MSQETPNPTRTMIAYFVGGIGAMCLIGALVIYMQRIFRPAPVGSARAEERAKIWGEMKAQNAEVLNNYAPIKAELGIYRLPVDQAMDLWANLNRDGNSAGHTQLIERLEASLKQVSYE